ncbi:MAG: DUF5060 domain-containing protein [Candidatus Solibacter sp.]
MKARLPFLFLAGLLGPSLFAAGDTPTFSPRVERWGMQEVTLHSSHSYANPFTDVTVQGRFRSQDKEVAVDGFYDGGGAWKIRFMPGAVGTWTFTTVSSDPELNGKSGTFAARNPAPANHGPIVIRNQYHFGYADESPFFPLGTTLYNWLNRDRDLELRTLATLSRNPFNKVRFLIFPKWMVFNRVDPPRYPYLQKEDGTFDLDRFDPEFFAHYETRIRDLQALGIEADIILFHPYDKWGFAAMDQGHDDAYLKYVMARFSSFRNIWWTLANEFDVFRTPKDWRHLGETVARLDPYGHVRGIHNCCFAFYDNSQPWITHSIIQDITLQRRTPTARDEGSIALDARKIGKPVLVDEYGYEGNNGQAWGNLGPREAVEMHWALTMAGAYGSHGETYVNPGHLLWWSVGGELVGDAPQRLGFLKKIMSEAPFMEMEPAPDLVTNGNPLITALAKRGSYYLFHFGETKEVADWNIGFFGPGTPSKPVGRAVGTNTFAPARIPQFHIGEGTFRVDMIDTWNMKVYTLGYTTGAVQSFQTQVAPGLLRFVKVERAEPGKPAGTVSALLNQFGQ